MNFSHSYPSLFLQQWPRGIPCWREKRWSSTWAVVDMQLSFLLQWLISQIERCMSSECNLFSVVFIFADKTITYCQYSNIKCIVHMTVVLHYTMLQWNREDSFFLYTTIAKHYKVVVDGPTKEELWTEN